MTDAVETAKAPGTFSLDKFLVDMAYPEDTVTVFTDARVGNEIIKLRRQRAEIVDSLELVKRASTQRTVGDDGYTVADPSGDSRIVAIDKHIAELEATLPKKALHVEMRGMPPHVVDAITAKHFTDPEKDYSDSKEETDRDHELIARSIIKITDADGNVAGTSFTPEDVAKLEGSLIVGEYMKLVTATAQINLNGALFDQATDASFLG